VLTRCDHDGTHMDLDMNTTVKIMRLNTALSHYLKPKITHLG
jgi:hypothetical protein